MKIRKRPGANGFFSKPAKIKKPILNIFEKAIYVVSLEFQRTVGFLLRGGGARRGDLTQGKLSQISLCWRCWICWTVPNMQAYANIGQCYWVCYAVLLVILGTESKLGENFLSLQCKDRGIYPLPPSIITNEFPPLVVKAVTTWKYSIKTKEKLTPTHTLWNGVGKLTNLECMASIFMSLLSIGMGI